MDNAAPTSVIGGLPSIPADTAGDNESCSCEIRKGNGNPGDQRVFRHNGWKTVRLFVSSRFVDFHSEREILVKKVFPDLRLWCQTRRLHLVECDLRWGAGKKCNDAQVLRVFLEEMDRCKEENTIPFFVNLTSERVGWVPLGKGVPEAVRNEYKWMDQLSAAEMEMMQAAYSNDNPNALFMVRDPSFLEDVPEEHKAMFIDSKAPSPYKLRMLKKMIEDAFPMDRVIRYRCSYLGYNQETGMVELDGLDGEFSEAVLESLKNRLTAEYPLDDAPHDPYQLQRNDHEAFMKQRSADLVGRETIFTEIETFIADPPVGAPFVLVGDPGSGKSSLMTLVADRMSTLTLNGKLPQSNGKDWHVFYHFVGAVPGSTDLFVALKRFLKEIDYVDAVA